MSLNVEEKYVVPAVSSEESARQRVMSIITHVLKMGEPIDRMILEEEGKELERLINGVRRQVIELYERLQSKCVRNGNNYLIRPLRDRLTKLFLLEDDQLAPTPEKVKEELLNFGILHLPRSGQELFSQAKLLIETVYIDQCQDVEQQRRVISIVAAMTQNDLVVIGRLSNRQIIKLNQEVWNSLKVESVLCQEDRQNAKNSFLPAPPVSRRTFERSMDETLASLSLDWDDIDWEVEG